MVSGIWHGGIWRGKVDFFRANGNRAGIPSEGARRHCIQQVRRANKPGHKRRFGLLINFNGRANLLNVALTKHGDAVAHGQGFFLVVGDKDKGDAYPLLNRFEFNLHFLAQLQI